MASDELSVELPSLACSMVLLLFMELMLYSLQQGWSGWVAACAA